MKVFDGIVVSNRMKDTVIVEVPRLITHRIYKKVLKRSRRYKVDTKGVTIKVGDKVKIVETKPISKDKNFVIYKEKEKKQ